MHLLLLLAAPLALAAPDAPSTATARADDDARAEADRFLALYNSLYVGISTVSSEASWDASTDVGDRT